MDCPVGRDVLMRQVFAGTYLSDGENRGYTVRENEARKSVYKKALYHCCKPGCSYGFDLQVHHIYEVSQGGTDDFTNYIILCKDCHQHSRLHRLSEDHKIELLVYKFYIERLELGFCSDEMDNEEFELRLRRLLAQRVDGVPER